ncbi:MAG: M48 family metallopeptidase [Methylovulum sp.]|uniref:M48 family metallopeptidase n=1 Tax=Methylovulum sp. TaxID=1916980 RepID=UPI00262A8D67|nr:M48 family metallopeptidase [Methylovulum sp.]MDD2725131.1 M48 family metallopeptidase [Methylovulum sp.]MDD5126413.1 M48 family metallopeptidase [Methylovulum sp.]
MLKKNLLVLLAAGLLNACVTSPTGRNQFIFMPEAQMDQMGLQTFSALKTQKPISHNPQYNKLTHCIANAITEQTGGKWEVVVFQDKSFNAFALPGNKIGVYTGLIEMVGGNQNQLAAVIGHEVGHVLARHSNERASQQMVMQQGMGIIKQTTLGQNPTTLGLLGLGAQYGVLMPFSRTQESEADIIGQDLMAKAGFDPRQSIILWQKMAQASQGQGPAEFMSTHPSDATRIQNLEQHMPQAMAQFQQAQATGRQPHCN